MVVDSFLLVCQECRAVFASNTVDGPESCTGCGSQTFKQFDLATALHEAGIDLG